jgi:AcrR family transcriptional regulator
VTEALRLTREVGLDNLSMRSLARSLGVPPMTIYNYVASKEALHRLVVNHVLGQIRIPGPDEGTWEERLRQLERDARQVMATHPGLSRELGHGDSEAATTLAEGVLSILRDGGFSPEAAVLCFATLYTFMTGQIELDGVSATTASRPANTTFDGATSSVPLTRDELFEFGFDALLEGLKLRLQK